MGDIGKKLGYNFGLSSKGEALNARVLKGVDSAGGFQARRQRQHHDGRRHSASHAQMMPQAGSPARENQGTATTR
jgi:hypothetical protein